MVERKHSHYFRPFPYDNIDIYRFLEVFDVTCPVAQHIIKKAVASGQRGHKDLQRDWQDIVDSAQRKLEMLRENDLAWYGCDEESLAELARQYDPHKHEKHYGEVTQRFTTPCVWYPDDIPGLEWKETTWERPQDLSKGEIVYYLMREGREEQNWLQAWGSVDDLDWSNEDDAADIVAYAVKPLENKTIPVQPKEVVPIVTFQTHGIDKCLFIPTSGTLDVMSNGAGKIGGVI